MAKFLNFKLSFLIQNLRGYHKFRLSEQNIRIQRSEIGLKHVYYLFSQNAF